MMADALQSNQMLQFLISCKEDNFCYLHLWILLQIIFNILLTFATDSKELHAVFENYKELSPKAAKHKHLQKSSGQVSRVCKVIAYNQQLPDWTEFLVGGGGVWRIFKWTTWSLSGILENLRGKTTPTPLSVMYYVGFCIKIYIPTPFFPISERKGGKSHLLPCTKLGILHENVYTHPFFSILRVMI